MQELRNGAVVASYLRSLSIDEPFGRFGIDGTNAEFYHHDALGTTLLLTNVMGAVKTTYTYAPFGETTMSGTPSTNPFQFTGRENDGAGLYYYRARYYSPLMQRFISEDPIGLMGGINVYAYVRNNPTRFIDPFGLDKQEKDDEDYQSFWYLLCFIDPHCEFQDTPPNTPYIPMVGNTGNQNAGATTINGREYSEHALQRMEQRGIPPSVVDNTIQTGAKSPGNVPGTTAYYDPVNNITAVTNSSGKVVTVRGGKP